MQTHLRRLASITFALLIGSSTTQAGDVYLQTNLVSNDQNVVQAQQTDPNLINPWGVSYSATSPLWVSDQGTGLATIYSLNTTPPTVAGLTVGIPNQSSAPRATSTVRPAR